MKKLIFGFLISCNLFAIENNVRPLICYTTADCVDSIGSTTTTVMIRKCSGIETFQSFKKYQVCKFIANKPFGYCELESTGFESNPNSCWNDEDLP